MMNIKKSGLVLLLILGSVGSAYAHDSFGFNINLGNPYYYYPSQPVYYSPPPVYVAAPRPVYHHQVVYSYGDAQPYYQDDERYYRHEHEHDGYEHEHEHEHRHHRDENEGE